MNPMRRSYDLDALQAANPTWVTPVTWLIGVLGALVIIGSLGLALGALA